MLRHPVFSFLSALWFASTVWATGSPIGATVEFREAAPTDLFTVSNDPGHDAWISELTIDLRGSAGEALFDPQKGGAGVLSVYPFTPIEGAEVTGFGAVSGDEDGSRQLTLSFSDFQASERMVFGIDVDDTMAGGVPVQNRITGEELNGTRIRLRFCLAGGQALTLEGSMVANRVHLSAEAINLPADAAVDPHCTRTTGDTAMLLDFRQLPPPHGRVINDTVMGGVSHASFQNTDEGTGLFQGEVSLANNGGFASVRLPLGNLDLSQHQGVLIHHRGDGQRFRLRLHHDQRQDSIAYQASFDSAEEWRETRLAFSDFQPTFRGRVPANAPPLDTGHIQQLGLMIADRQAGPFWLEIEYIRAY